jgi:uncharacterized protein
MRRLLAQFGWLRVVAVVIAAVPLVLLPVLGTVWLWQSGALLWWLLAVLLAAAVGLALNRVAVAREQRALPESTTQPGAHWPAEAERCWAKVEQLAQDATPREWPLSDGAALMRLARQVLVMVAATLPSAQRPAAAGNDPAAHPGHHRARGARIARGHRAQHPVQPPPEPRHRGAGEGFRGAAEAA